ncbi:MAG TPA: CoA-binding protein, partial [Candidatus Lokiarchaeia archaeon]|nr:CoA-binding protein [Candidatus Lokiarchaeia archaeon]
MDPETYQKFDAYFHPKAIAVFGPSSKRGYYWLRSLISGGFQGKIFPIHPKQESALGLRFYKNLMDVPDDVDYAILEVPAQIVPQAVRDCVEKGVKFVTIFTSGFAEMGAEGRQLEEEILKIIEGTETRINGPNCMGIYCPRGGLSIRSDIEPRDGNIAFVSQSGGIAINTVMHGVKLNLGFSKVISVGNSIDLNPVDYIEYLTEDPRTKVIALYLESFGHTQEEVRKLVDVLKTTMLKKPVVLWKGGVTDRGAIAAASHTGALRSNRAIINAVIRQTGVIAVRTFEEFIDTLVAFQMLKLPLGRGIGLVSVSGGVSVTNSDLIVDMGMKVPVLDPDTVDQITKVNMVQNVGVSPQNPIDLGSSYFAMDINEKTIFELARDPNVNAVIIEISTHYIYNARILSVEDFPRLFFESMMKCVKEIRTKVKKPVLIALPDISYEEETLQDRHAYLNRNLPVFPNVERAAIAIRNLVTYREFLESRQN